MLTNSEILLLVILSVGVIGIPIGLYFSKNYYAIWSPLTMVCAVYLYYAVIGPIYALISGEEIIIRLIDHREYYSIAMFSCIVSFYCICLGFISKRSIKNVKFRLNYVVSLTILKDMGIWLMIISIVLFTIFSGGDIMGRINFLDLSKGTQDMKSNFASYFMLSINFLIVAVILVFFYYLKKKTLWYFIAAFLLVASLFINEAFRYRLIILIFSLFTAYHLYTKKKPRIVLMATVVIPFVILMGTIEVAREYGRGIDITKIEDRDYGDLAEQSLNETAVFWSSGYFMDNAVELYGYTYFDFITNAIAAPIPRRIWPGKPNGSYLLQTNNMYGSLGKGQAYLNFTEYYLSFGWIGVIIISFLWGYFFKTVWLWFLRYKEHPLAITAISVFNAFIYVIISRSYTTQHLTLFFFTVYPAFFVIWFYRKYFATKYINANNQYSRPS